MKKIILSILIILTLIFASGCGVRQEYEQYEDNFFDTFDTWIKFVGYTESQEEFNEYADLVRNNFSQLHKYYDKYISYDGVNNIKTINDNAGIEPVKVQQEIIDLLKFAIEWNKKAGSESNIAFGPVLEIWHNYREDAELDPENASIPPMEVLRQEEKYTDINKIIIDEENSTVFLEDENMSLDVGAVAKGYATEVIARQVKEAGLEAGIISAGGNVKTIGSPLDGVRDKWGIGIQDPEVSIIGEDTVLDTAFIKEKAVVSSGDYQRYYIVDGQVIHHIIDPKTLMPGDYYRAVTVIADDSGVADFLSTSVFLLPIEEALELVGRFDDVEAIWIFKDGSIETSPGMDNILKSKGARNSN